MEQAPKMTVRGLRFFYGTKPAIHGIDLIGYLGGGYLDVGLRYQDVGAGGGRAANILMDCMMGSGAVARLEFLPVVGRGSESVTIHTDTHTYVARFPGTAYESDSSLTIYAADRLVREVTPSDMGEGTQLFEVCGFYHEIATFLDELGTTGVNTHSGIETALQSVALAEAVRNRDAAWSASAMEYTRPPI